MITKCGTLALLGAVIACSGTGTNAPGVNTRNGKGALIVGALDERIQLTIQQESGFGGSASWRVSDFMQAEWIAAGSPADPVSQDVQTLHQIVNENVWFRSSFRQFSYSANKLPFDHHMLEGLVAPRALLVIENT